MAEVKPAATRYVIDRLQELNARAAGDPENLTADEREEYMLLASTLTEAMAQLARTITEAFLPIWRAILESIGRIIDALPEEREP